MDCFWRCANGWTRVLGANPGQETASNPLCNQGEPIQPLPRGDMDARVRFLRPARVAARPAVS